MTDAGSDAGLIKVAVMAEVKATFRPEFVNRIDEIVVFHPLDEAQIANIARIQLRNLEQRLAKMDIHLDVDEAALKAVAAAGFDPVYGARPLKRAIQQQIENPLAKEILAGHYAPGETVRVTATLGEIVFENTGGVRPAEPTAKAEAA
jgi:ATP-dependent Clp protease ATP-binding subunit ClpB